MITVLLADETTDEVCLSLAVLVFCGEICLKRCDLRQRCPIRAVVAARVGKGCAERPVGRDGARILRLKTVKACVYVAIGAGGLTQDEVADVRAVEGKAGVFFFTSIDPAEIDLGVFLPRRTGFARGGGLSSAAVAVCLPCLKRLPVVCGALCVPYADIEGQRLLNASRS